ncbi:MAG: hypothetical protein KC766_30810 [Myxococcales bacterium]|nr:hypothetical protein [Myxococcales bacterium]
MRRYLDDLLTEEANCYLNTPKLIKKMREEGVNLRYADEFDAVNQSSLSDEEKFKTIRGMLSGTGKFGKERLSYTELYTIHARVRYAESKAE